MTILQIGLGLFPAGLALADAHRSAGSKYFGSTCRMNRVAVPRDEVGLARVAFENLVGFGFGPGLVRALLLQGDKPGPNGRDRLLPAILETGMSMP